MQAVAKQMDEDYHYYLTVSQSDMGKRGVLLMNIGTPDEATVPSVRKYLREFLLDPDVIDIPTVLRHILVRGIIPVSYTHLTLPTICSV